MLWLTKFIHFPPDSRDNCTFFIPQLHVHFTCDSEQLNNARFFFFSLILCTSLYPVSRVKQQLSQTVLTGRGHHLSVVKSGPPGLIKARPTWSYHSPCFIPAQTWLIQPEQMDTTITLCWRRHLQITASAQRLANVLSGPSLAPLHLLLIEQSRKIILWQTFWN